MNLQQSQMEHPTWHNIHPDFQLNGASYTREDVLEIGYSLVKEGEDHEIHIGDFLLDWVSDRPILEVFTSGSTGKPKKIKLQKEHMVNSALATGSFFKLSPRNTALLCLPCSGIAGKMMLVRAMVLGLQVDYVNPSSTPLENNSKAYDFAAMVPLQVQHSLSKLSRIKKLIIGGAPVEIGLKQEISKSGIQVYETYGMTETITHIALKELAPVPKPYFETLPNVSITLDNRGCLVIDAPKVSDDKVITNDLAEIISNRQFTWLGRFDSIINSGGVKLVPEQIEQKLSGIIEGRYFVTGTDDATLGQKLVLILEGQAKDSMALLESIKSANVLSKYEVPKAVYFVKSFVETPTKKIDRAKTMEGLFS